MRTCSSTRDPRRVRCLALADLERALVHADDFDRVLATAELSRAEEERLGMGGRSHRAQVELARGRPQAALDVLIPECSFEATELRSNRNSRPAPARERHK